MQKYKVGDIVYVSNFEDISSKGAEAHYFIVIDEEQSVISADLYGFLISSNKEKCKENNPYYKYNEPIKKTSKNGLKEDSHVKCDKLYNFKSYFVVIKIGEVETPDFLRFINAYETYTKELSKETVKQ